MTIVYHHKHQMFCMSSVFVFSLLYSAAAKSWTDSNLYGSMSRQLFVEKIACKNLLWISVSSQNSWANVNPLLYLFQLCTSVDDVYRAIGSSLFAVQNDPQTVRTACDQALADLAKLNLIIQKSNCEGIIRLETTELGLAAYKGIPREWGSLLSGIVNVYAYSRFLASFYEPGDQIIICFLNLSLNRIQQILTIQRLAKFR